MSAFVFRAAQLPPPSPRSSVASSPPATSEITTSNSAMSRLAPDNAIAASTASNGHTHSGNISPRPTRNSSMTEGKTLSMPISLNKHYVVILFKKQNNRLRKEFLDICFHKSVCFCPFFCFVSSFQAVWRIPTWNCSCLALIGKRKHTYFQNWKLNLIRKNFRIIKTIKF